MKQDTRQKNIKKKRNYTYEITDVRDIKSDILYTKSNYILAYVRIKPTNIKLLAKEELKSRTRAITAEFKSEREPFAFLSIPRNVDMDHYLKFLVDANQKEYESEIRRELLNEMIAQATKMVVMGEAFEHQYYVKKWSKYNEHVSNCESQLNENTNNFVGYFKVIGNEAERLDHNEILKLCNLFANGESAILEEYNIDDYIPISFLKDE